MSLMELRDWRRTAVEQSAAPEVIKELDDVIEMQEKKLAGMECRKTPTKRQKSRRMCSPATRSGRPTSGRRLRRCIV